MADDARAIPETSDDLHAAIGEEKVIGAGEGVLLPRGTFYWVQTVSKEPMVLLRVGSSSAEGDRFARIDSEGAIMPGDDPRNKKRPLVMSDRWYGRG